MVKSLEGRYCDSCGLRFPTIFDLMQKID